MNIATDAPTRPALRKTCNKCKETKPVSEFHRNPKTRDGYYTDCKECCATYQREYRKQNREKLGQDKKLYAEQNRDVVLAKKRAYAAANRKNESARAIQWQKDNPDKVIVRSKLRRFRQRAHNRTVSKPKRSAIASNYNSIFMSIGRRDGFCCAQCSSSHDLVIDHIVALINGGGNEMGNLQLLCSACNAKKSDK